MRFKKSFVALIAIATLSIGLMACGKPRNVTSVSAQAFEAGIKTHDVQLLDVRTANEYDSVHISGAMNINVASPDFLVEAEKALSKDRPVYVYCRSGRRSLTAADILAKHGYDVVNLDGGIKEWTSEGLPVLCD